MQVLSEHISDILIIGSGAAGLSIALRLAQHCKVIVLSKGTVTEGATFYAQGGIAAVFYEEKDSIAAHLNDTLIAGAGLCDKRSVEFIIRNARHCVQWLINQGVLFDTEVNCQGEVHYHLTQEGGHSHRRILHSSDATGKEIETTLVDKAKTHPNICIIEHRSAVDLISSNKIGLPDNKRRVIGAYVWNRQREYVEIYRARMVVLATGGASNVYRYTTNPDTSSGDGITMAWRAGCRVANLEFNQFHPTCMFHPKGRKNFLLTEALRGEGAYLKRPDGSRFMPDFDLRNELAPRDVVTRAIDYEMKRLDVNCMYLDISHKPEKFVTRHFPMIYKKLLTLGFDLTKVPIPIVPAAHYTCGGIMVDQYGRTDISGLYAIGEVSYTGLHGANRMASNSLLECLVYGWSAANDILKNLPLMQSTNTPLSEWNASGAAFNTSEEVMIRNNCQELRLFMWDCVGVVRTIRKLESAMRYIDTLKKEVDEYYANFRISSDSLELRSLVETAKLIVQCAMIRKESRGLHYILDYPDSLPKALPTILRPS